MKTNPICCSDSSCAAPQLDANFWEARYNACDTGWDMGAVSPPLKTYIDGLADKDIRILIPGCGNAYEATYLFSKGFSDITLIDVAATPVENLRNQFSDSDAVTIIQGDFFDHSGQYDLILEQTFFCAIHPSLRRAYVEKTHDLLVPGGRLAGLLFNKQMDAPGPPFGGDEKEYRQLFSGLFQIRHMEPCHNSHPKRQGSELFIELEKSKKHPA